MMMVYTTTSGEMYMDNICDEEYYLLLKGICDISEGALPDRRDYFIDAESLLLKAFYHSASFAHIANGTNIPPLKARFLDPATPQIIARSALETALVFNHIYIYPSSVEHRELYYDFWVFKGLRTRHENEPKLIEPPDFWEEEKKEISKLEEKISNNSLFISIEKNVRKNCLKSKDWRIPLQSKINNGFHRPSWMEIAEHAQMSKKHLDQIYGFLSNYAHSNYISVMQVHQAESDEDRINLIAGTVDTIKIALVLLIDGYAKLFPLALNKLNENLGLKNAVKLWREISSIDLDKLVPD